VQDGGPFDTILQGRDALKMTTKAAYYWGFQKAAQSLVRPWALILGGRLYGAKI